MGAGRTKQRDTRAEDDARTKDEIEKDVPDRIFRRGEVGAMIESWLVATREADLRDSGCAGERQASDLAHCRYAALAGSKVGRLAPGDGSLVPRLSASSCKSLVVAGQFLFPSGV